MAGEPVGEYVRRPPAPPLRALVAEYGGYREAGAAPRVHRGLPSPYLTMIVTLDDPLVVAAHPDPRTPPGSYDTLVGGLHTTPALITHDGRQSGVQISLTPPGARALLGVPAGELSGLDLDGADVLGRLACELRERLREAPGWSERFTVLDEVLLRRVASAPAPAAEVQWAWRRIASSGGGVSVADLAAGVGWSTRHLADRFRREIGLGPKEACRVVRFHRVRRALQQAALTGSRLTLADAAAAHGYCDQAHLAREFGALAGLPPSAWLAEEFPWFRNVQAAGLGPATDSWA
ncbi:helix-turn-helix domain-containing protein [Microbispora sp. ATCC PTA-5024]|uniref:helix-turn-helix domain-containing protein n=1 Tax=Microbispora sp. ATCC PTA-5024 TaxID=316330 RepID=UPI0003F72239|nr:AraC family transcriptional regulator [Microbispora sp. ATCC PTA-5024]